MKTILKNTGKMIKSLVLWAIVPENRKVGIKYTRKALEIAEIVSEQTKNKKDDKAVAFLVKSFQKALLVNNVVDNSELNAIENKINKISEGSLKDVKLGVDTSGIKMKLGKTGVNYNPKDGSIKFGISF